MKKIEILTESEILKIKERKSKGGFTSPAYERKVLSERIESKREKLLSEEKELKAKKLLSEEEEVGGEVPAEGGDDLELKDDLPAEGDEPEMEDEPAGDDEYENEVRDAISAYTQSDEFREKYGEEADDKAAELEEYVDGLFDEEEDLETEEEPSGDDDIVSGGDEGMDEPLEEGTVYGCLECEKKFNQPTCPICESDLSESVLRKGKKLDEEKQDRGNCNQTCKKKDCCICEAGKPCKKDCKCTHNCGK